MSVVQNLAGTNVMSNCDRWHRLTVPTRDMSSFIGLKTACSIQRDHLEALDPDTVYLRSRHPKFLNLSVNGLY